MKKICGYRRAWLDGILFCVQGIRVALTIRAVFILGSIDGAIWLHLQLEALATGKPGHNAL